MMDSSTCATIVLILLWLYLCFQALASLVAPIYNNNTTSVLSSSTTLSTVLLGVCLWQCHRAGYLVSPMTWYHWVLVVLLLVLQVMAVVMEYQGQQTGQSYVADWTYPIYGISVVLLCILGGTLYCGWKCNLFCRPCCKSQYICYGGAIVVVLVLLMLLAVTASMIRHQHRLGSYADEADTEKAVIQRLSKTVIPITQCYTTAIIWTTLLKLPYTIPEVVALLASALAVASMLVLAVLGRVLGHQNMKVYPLLAIHLVAMGITWYCLEYNRIFYWPKDYLCFGLLAVVLLVALVTVVIANLSDEENDHHDVQYTLIGYSLVLMVPTLWYAYRCGLLKWCLPKKKGPKAAVTAENTAAETDIAKE